MKHKLQKENKNGKVKRKWAKNIFVVTGIGTIIVSFIPSFGTNKNKSQAIETTTEPATLYIDSGEDIPIKSALNKAYISITDETYSNFIKYLNSIQDTYEYKKYYQIEESLKKYNELKKDINTKDDIRDNNNDDIKGEVLYKRVIENNKQYLSNGDTVVTCFYQEMDNSQLLKICNLVADIVNSTIEKKPKIDKEKIYSNLCKLKIFNTNSSAGNMAQVTSDYCLKVSPSMLKIYQSIHEEENTNISVFAHEVMHMLQSGYIELKKDDVLEISGPCVKFKNQEINPLYWSFMLEALAEESMSSVTGNSTTMYPNQRSYIDTLKLCCILDNNTNLDDLLNASFNNDITDLYRFFDAKTNYERETIISMLYNIQTIEQRDPSEFINLYKRLYGEDLSQNKDKLSKIKQNLRCEVYVTLSKMFYKNLMKKIHEEKVSFSDVLYLIRIFESDMHTHLLYTEEDRFVDTIEFIETYKEIQGNFFSAISKDMNRTTEDMYNELNNYSMLTYDENGNICNNFSLNFLGKDKKEFILKVQKNVYKTGIPNIVDIKKSSFSK